MADNQLLENLNNDPNSAELVEIISTIMKLPEESLQDTTKESLIGMFAGAFTPTIQDNTIKGIIEFFDNHNYTRTEARSFIDNLKAEVRELIDSLSPSKAKRDVLEGLFNQLISLYDRAIEKYRTAAIILNMTLEEGAHEPTYAHETDAGADIYAAETITLQPHSLSNKIKTGLRITLPENWVGYIIPRSSIGMKTPLRLSNSIGCIDSLYRGEIGVLYDNISDEPYTINAGDRIAQLIIMPCYHFKANVVEKLDETERGEGGFGSSGK